MTQRGRFIVLEGGEGAGKSTQIAAVAARLRDSGRRVLCTREPGGSPLAEAVRDLILREWPEGVDSTTELLLIFAARAAHLHASIRPALADGVDVLCDRFIDATYAYQGAGRGLDARLIDPLARLVVGDLQPDRVIVLDLPPELGLQRTRARGLENRFEAEDLGFQRRVRAAYLNRARQSPDRYAVVDATQEEAEVTARLMQIIGRLP